MQLATEANIIRKGAAEVLKEKDEDLNNKTKRVLKYIYQDVYLECFDKLMDIVIERVINEGAAVGSIRYDQAIEPYTESKKQLSVFLDGDESIVTYLLDFSSVAFPSSFLLIFIFCCK